MTQREIRGFLDTCVPGETVITVSFIGPFSKPQTGTYVAHNVEVLECKIDGKDQPFPVDAIADVRNG